MALEPVKLETKILQLETTVHIFEEIIQNEATPMELNWNKLELSSCEERSIKWSYRVKNSVN